MKSKLAILSLALVCLWAMEAKADTVIDITATYCGSCFNTPNPPTLNLTAQLTVKPVFGQFFVPVGGFLTAPETEYEVTSMTGTLSGSDLALTGTVNPSPVALFTSGNLPWLDLNLKPGYIPFTAGGSFCWLETDPDTFNFLEISDASGDGFGSDNPLNFRATIVGTPEPSTLILLGVGLLGLYKSASRRANL